MGNQCGYDFSEKALPERAKRLTEAMDIEEQVYRSLTGSLIPECRLPWVENNFVPGHPFCTYYSKMLSAYERLCERLGVANSDEDVEEIICSLLNYGEIAAIKTFEYGRKYQQMLDRHTSVRYLSQ